MKKLGKIFALASGIIAGVFLVINITDIIIGIIARQGINNIVWTEELARISLVWCVMLGASAAFYEGDNMSIDFLVNILPRPAKKFCEFLSFMIEIIVLCVLIYYGFQNVKGGWTMRTLALHIPRAVPLMAVPLGMGLLLITKFLGGKK